MCCFLSCLDREVILYNIILFSGLVPLHNACSYGHFEVTELLIKVFIFSIMFEEYKMYGTNAMWLFKCENTTIVILCLFQHGACVNVADLWKFTPLHEAAAKGKFEICKLLLKVSALFVKKSFLSFNYRLACLDLMHVHRCRYITTVRCILAWC